MTNNPSFLIAIALLCSPSFAQEKIFECRWAETPPVIDGKGDDAVWAAAETVERFRVPGPKSKDVLGRTATKAKLLWDREHLYFLADMEDADLYADIKTNDDALWTNDVFELFFKPSDSEPSYYEFEINAAGAKLDLFFPSRGAGGYQRFKSDVPFTWETKVSLRGTLNNWRDRDTGWTVEGKIPWRDFLRAGGRPDVDERWKFTLCRYDYSVGFEQADLTASATIQARDFHRYEDYSTLRFVGPDVTAQGKTFGMQRGAALVTSTVVGSPEPPAPYRAKRVYPGLKLTYPVCVEREPTSRRFYILDQSRPYGPVRLLRTGDDPNRGELEELLRFSYLAYSLCFHPKFAENGYLFVGHNDGAVEGKRMSRITRYTIGRTAPHTFDKSSAKTILEWESNGHNGVAMTFGLDGMFYVTSGDGTSDSDTNVMGQRLDTLLSKVLRIDVDRPTDSLPYSVPPDNPFVGQKDARPETWAYGFRNPWRITTDPKSGRIWVGNNGQDLWEQVYLVQRGANYGWSVYEGSQPFYLTRQLGPTPHSPPTVEHSHAESRSLTGGVVYHGTKLAELRGAYIYGDHSTGKIWGAHHDGQRLVWSRELTDTPFNITAFATDHDGELLIVDHRGNDEGGLYTLEPTPPTTEPSRFPRRLSDSGLFTSVKDRRPAPGVIPYSVNSPLWSDGSHKERFLAIPADAGDETVKGPYALIGGAKAWKFPDRTVLVKSFALDLVEGDPTSRRWIETRFLTKQNGEWVGYSYEWNDEQTDATLVAPGGGDRQFTIRTANGQRRQPWHYPSRTECMVCHSRAAGFVLGLSTPQMNRDHQLQTLERLGLLRLNWHAETTNELRAELRAKDLKASEIEAKVRELLLTRDMNSLPLSSLLTQPAERLPKLADPYDPRQPLESRARAYLHANCAHCHVAAGGGNAQFDIEQSTLLSATRLLDAKPQHHTFGLNNARLIAAGHPERSVLLHRVSIRDRGQMPQLATTRADEQAVKLLTEWIRSLPPAEGDE